MNIDQTAFTTTLDRLIAEISIDPDLHYGIAEHVAASDIDDLIEIKTEYDGDGVRMSIIPSARLNSILSTVILRNHTGDEATS